MATATATAGVAAAAVIGGKSRASYTDYHPKPKITAGAKVQFKSNPKPPNLKMNRLQAAAAVVEEDVEEEEEESRLEALLLLQKSILENQWNHHPIQSACNRRTMRRRRRKKTDFTPQRKNKNPLCSSTTTNNKGGQEELLSHSQVVLLSRIIKTALSLQHCKSKLKEKLGYDPSDHQLATSLRISPTELQSKLIQASLAREKLSMSNVRLVISIAKKYENMGAEMADLVQGGLIGLVRGIEKFDSSKGFKISTYVYWWIRQGVSRALVENSRTLRLPAHLHERLSLIRNAKLSLEEKGITPSTERIAKWLNMTEKKVRNATEATSKIFSLDREAFPSLNGLRGETLHSYIADNRLENNPWHGVDEWTLKEEVNNMIKETLREREQDIVRLYYGLGTQSLTWEDISKRIGLSRERVRQVGLVALEKLKTAARRRNLESLLVKH
ncbi:hypothetical protein ACHQM5_007864 [Ranunculus cassubicifolius]